ncbi:hypothetical protein KBA73_01900 [Patescibacteria group bacterium]|nr:hypothetical protein [Patescibacteria group bacterium]
MRRLFTAFCLTFVCLLGFAGEAKAQLTSPAVCTNAQCPRPPVEICRELYGRQYLAVSDNTPGNCAVETCAPSRDQCDQTFVVCAPVEAAAVPPPHRSRPPVDDACDVNAVPDEEHPGTCRSTVEGYQPTFIGQLRGRGRHWRMELRDRSGRRHIGFFNPNGSTVTNNTVTNGAGPSTNTTTTVTQELTPDQFNRMRDEVARAVMLQVNEANRLLAAQVERLAQRLRVRPSLLLNGTFTVTGTPRETFTLLSPSLGGALNFDRFDESGRGWGQVWASVGVAFTGHVCPAIRFEGGVRIGGAIDDGHVFTLFGGWRGGWDNVPCTAPSGGAADGVHWFTGPELGAVVRIWDGLHLTGSIMWTPLSRLTVDATQDLHGVTNFGAGVQLEYRFGGP